MSKRERFKRLISNLYSPEVLFLGIIGAGIAPLAAYSISLVSNFSDQIYQSILYGDFEFQIDKTLYYLPEILKKAEAYAADKWRIGFMGGIFSGYLIRTKLILPIYKKIKSFLGW